MRFYIINASSSLHASLGQYFATHVTFISEHFPIPQRFLTDIQKHRTLALAALPPRVFFQVTGSRQASDPSDEAYKSNLLTFNA